jgi:hypothetical protein
VQREWFETLISAIGYQLSAYEKALAGAARGGDGRVDLALVHAVFG